MDYNVAMFGTNIEKLYIKLKVTTSYIFYISLLVLYGTKF